WPLDSVVRTETGWTERAGETFSRPPASARPTAGHHAARGRDRRVSAIVAAFQPPALFVNHDVVTPAQEGQVLQVCRATVRPVDQVMPVGPPAGHIATLEDAPIVPSLELAPERCRDGPASLADLVLELGASGDPGDRRVAGKPPDGLGMDRPASLELPCGRTSQAGHRVRAGPNDQVRPLTGHVRQPLAAELAPAELDQGIGLPLA